MKQRQPNIFPSGGRGEGEGEGGGGGGGGRGRGRGLTSDLKWGGGGLKRLFS